MTPSPKVPKRDFRLKFEEATAGASIDENHIVKKIDLFGELLDIVTYNDSLSLSAADFLHFFLILGTNLKKFGLKVFEFTTEETANFWSKAFVDGNFNSHALAEAWASLFPAAKFLSSFGQPAASDTASTCSTTTPTSTPTPTPTPTTAPTPRKTNEVATTASVAASFASYAEAVSPKAKNSKEPATGAKQKKSSNSAVLKDKWPTTNEPATEVTREGPPTSKPEEERPDTTAEGGWISVKGKSRRKPKTQESPPKLEARMEIDVGSMIGEYPSLYLRSVRIETATIHTVHRMYRAEGKTADGRNVTVTHLGKYLVNNNLRYLVRVRLGKTDYQVLSRVNVLKALAFKILGSQVVQRLASAARTDLQQLRALDDAEQRARSKTPPVKGANQTVSATSQAQIDKPVVSEKDMTIQAAAPNPGGNAN